jgi:hypothetical protein
MDFFDKLVLALLGFGGVSTFVGSAARDLGQSGTVKLWATRYVVAGVACLTLAPLVWVLT